MKAAHYGDIFPWPVFPADKTLVMISSPFRVLLTYELTGLFVKIVTVKVKTMTRID
jgi:hypothetical protein